jgi:glutamate-5-semialdehyde dehydrogenase
MTELERVVREARAAGRVLARLPSHRKAVVLEEMADAVERRMGEILRENQEDVDEARRGRVAPALVDRLLLDEDRVSAMAAGVRAVAALGDPVGEVDHGWRLANGLQVVRQRVPFGVVAVIYEGRPNVTTDAAALCVASGNAVVLRGSRLARRSNRILAEVLAGALIEAEAPPGAIAMLGTDREELRELIQLEGLVDLVIPRGGEELKAFLKQNATVPVIYAAAGNNHVYVDAGADLDMALKIAVNAKVSRPGVCNSAETLLVHRDEAAAFLPAAVDALTASGVELRVCTHGLEILGDRANGLREATDEDYATEFLAMIMAVRVVDSLDDAVEHVERFGSGHSEAIVTRSLDSAIEFQTAVDAACVYVNASTRFTDGGEFGMGAEIANSTQKLHARGPIGLTELTTVKYLVTGDGQVR